MKTYTDRRGFAMPAAIGALVIMAALVSAGFYMARQELRIGVASNYANMAVNVAQMGSNEVMANWNGYQLGNIPIWGDTTIVDTTNVGIWTVNIMNTNNVIYYLDATGEITQGEAWGGATRNIGIVARLIYADIDPPAALTTRGKTALKGTPDIIGLDDPPSGWGGYCSSSQDKPGVMTNDASDITENGSPNLDGSPPVDEDSTIVGETFTTFGDMDWDDFVELASLEGKNLSSVNTFNDVAPVDDGTTCDESMISNWGDPDDPTAPCGSYFPLMYHGGNVSIQGNSKGQGILLVEGDLSTSGTFQFYGLIIVQGTIDATGTFDLFGAAMASNADFDNQTFGGTMNVRYSSCTVQRAILNNASLSRARPLANRSWIDLSAVLN